MGGATWAMLSGCAPSVGGAGRGSGGRVGAQGQQEASCLGKAQTGSVGSQERARADSRLPTKRVFRDGLRGPRTTLYACTGVQPAMLLSPLAQVKLSKAIQGI